MTKPYDEMTGEDILALTFPDEDVDGNPMFIDCEAETIRDYFKELLSKLWEEGECFSGKRPLGNSGWEYHLWDTLIYHGFPDERSLLNQKIFEAIDAL